MVGIGADAGNHFGITGLHGAQCTAHCDDAAGAAERNMIEPSNRDPQVLGETDRRVGRQREAADTQAGISARWQGDGYRGECLGV